MTHTGAETPTRMMGAFDIRLKFMIKKSMFHTNTTDCHEAQQKLTTQDENIQAIKSNIFN